MLRRPSAVLERAWSGLHLRRSLEREVGVSPVELAQTHRLLLAKHLLADTALPVTRIAYASGFQSQDWASSMSARSVPRTSVWAGPVRKITTTASTALPAS